MGKSGDARGVRGGFEDFGEALKRSGTEANETCDGRPRRQLTGNEASNEVADEARDVKS